MDCLQSRVGLRFLRFRKFDVLRDLVNRYSQFRYGKCQIVN
jgi:hypothetical protein